MVGGRCVTGGECVRQDCQCRGKFHAIIQKGHLDRQGSGKQQPAPVLDLAETVDDFADQFEDVCFGGRMSKYWALSANL